MLLLRRPRALLLVLAGTLALGAASSSADNEELLEANRRRLERWRADPEHYQRLQRDLRAFYALPPLRQEQLRQLDHRLNDGDPSARARLWAVLERYAGWLDSLPPEVRQPIVDAADPTEKLRLIRERRLLEALDRLPAALQQAVRALPPEQWADRVARIRAEERRQRQAWAKLYRPRDEFVPNPVRLSEFPAEVRNFVEAKLLPRLSQEEEQRLRQAEGRWPDLARAIRELSDAHPVLPPLPAGPVTGWKELPAEAQKQLRRVDKRKLEGLDALAGKWPEFALGLTRLLEAEKLTPVPLGASRPGEFPQEVRAFLRVRLLPLLSPSQEQSLQALQGRWPAYPKQLLRLARERRLVIPGMSLPGPAQLWESARAALPDVPDRLLIQFALHELSPEERARMELSPADPMGSREKLKKAWYRQKAAEQERRSKRGQKAVLQGGS